MVDWEQLYTMHTVLNLILSSIGTIAALSITQIIGKQIEIMIQEKYLPLMTTLHALVVLIKNVFRAPSFFFYFHIETKKKQTKN